VFDSVVIALYLAAQEAATEVLAVAEAGADTFSCLALGFIDHCLLDGG
jgi:hypothetical protein